MYVGSLVRLKFYDILFLISNVGLLKPSYAVSMGTYCLINNKKKYHITLSLPSGTQISLSNRGYALLGRNGGVHTYGQYFGKASTSLFQKKINIRSIAKNPVDHPNGGRTRGKMCFKTP